MLIRIRSGFSNWKIEFDIHIFSNIVFSREYKFVWSFIEYLSLNSITYFLVYSVYRLCYAFKLPNVKLNGECLHWYCVQFSVVWFTLRVTFRHIFRSLSIKYYQCQTIFIYWIENILEEQRKNKWLDVTRSVNVYG